jgi:hypothetical protein
MQIKVKSRSITYNYIGEIFDVKDIEALGYINDREDDENWDFLKIKIL